MGGFRVTKRVKAEEVGEMDGEGKRGRWRKQIGDKRWSLVFQWRA